jgi:hypothetical protein
LKYQSKEKKKLRTAFGTMEGLCHVMPVAGLKRPYTGKDDDEL